jgi:outer membrane receptor protein involved in Fe transport
MASYIFTRNNILLLLAFLLVNTLLAQNTVTLSGSISDETSHEKLPGVTISINKQVKGVSDKQGYYSITLLAGNYAITYSYIGFEEKTDSLNLSANLQHDVNMKVSLGQLDQVVVSAGRYEQEVKRLTVSTEVIKPYLIENKGTTNMEKIMNQVPSVNVVDGQVNIRGGSGWTYGAGSRVLVMLDDMPYLTGDAGQVAWKFLPTENIEQVEVIKGASSVLYGSSALNGVINIRTAYAKNKPVTQITPFIGWYNQPTRDSLRWTNNTQLQTGFNAFHSHRIKQLDLVMAANYLKDEGYRFGEDDERFRFSWKTNYRSKKITGLTYGINGSLLAQNSSSFLLWDGYPRGGYMALDSQKTITHGFNYSIDPHIDFYTKGIKHRIRTRYLNIHYNNEAPDSSVDQDNSSWLMYGEYQLQAEVFKSLGVITGGIAGTYCESNSPLFQGIHNSMNYAPFLQVDIHYKRVSATVGMRTESYSMNTQKDRRTIFRTGVNLEATKSTFFRASYGEGYRYPSIAERFIQTTVGAINIFPNPGLQPESGWNAELGIKQGFTISKWTGYVDLAYFYTEYDNMVEFNFGQWAGIQPPPTIDHILQAFGFKSFNVGRTRIKGWDLSVGGQGKIHEVEVKLLAGLTLIDPVSLEPTTTYATDSASPSKNYTYRYTSSDTTGDVLKYRYKQLGKFDLQLNYKRYMLGISMRYNSYMQNIDKIFIDPQFALAVPGISRAREMNKDGDYIWDFRFGVTIIKQLSINFIVNNVFNHEMMTRPADLGPPRMMMVQVQCKL